MFLDFGKTKQVLEILTQSAHNWQRIREPYSLQTDMENINISICVQAAVVLRGLKDLAITNWTTSGNAFNLLESKFLP